MSQKLYYTEPDDKYFEEMKNAAIAIWSTYDDTYGYASEKIWRIKDIENVSDNFMYILAMFDINNQESILSIISPECQKEVQLRMF